MSAPKRCVCGHLLNNHRASRPGCLMVRCDCTGYHRRASAVRLGGRPSLDLCRKTDYTGELK